MRDSHRCGPARVPWNAAVATALVVLAGGGATVAPPARAAVPTGVPVFTNPMQIDNAYFPIVPGAIKVYLGREDGRRVTLVVTHLTETREFQWDGDTVTCRIVQEHKFIAGRLVEENLGFFAQSDDGGVRGFGEVEDGPSPDDEPGEPNGWIVGQLAPTDPPSTVSVADPSLFMPANPEVGDIWDSESAGPQDSEQFQVTSASTRVRVQGARLRNTLRIRATSPDERGGENLWFARDVGLVKSAERGSRLRLNATTLGRRTR